MPGITVDFDMPSEILQGLLNGNYTRCGGVIRDEAGHIIKHLVETGQYINTENATIMQQMQAMKLAGNLALSANLVTLGVVSVGFLVMNQKLAKMEDKLNEISAGIEKIERKIDFIQDRIDVKLLAKLKAAVSIGENALLSRNGRKERFLEAHHKFIEVKCETQGIMEMIREKYGIVPFYEMYAHYGACYTVAAMGETKSALYLEEPEIAMNSSNESANELREMGECYKKSFNPRRVEVQKIRHSEIVRVKQYHSEFDEMRERVESLEAQIQMMLRTGTSFVELTEMCRGNEMVGPIAYLTEAI